MSLFFIVSDEAGEGLTTLLPLLGAVKHQGVAFIWNEKAEALRESIRQARLSLKSTVGTSAKTRRGPISSRA
ncbi:MAG: hypothetical protein WAM82_07490 [Thermoanaerobaculia bacterium]